MYQIGNELCLAIKDKHGNTRIPCTDCPIDFQPVGVEVIKGSSAVSQLFDPQVIGEYVTKFNKSGIPDLFVIGEAPGYYEAKHLRPFVGKSGTLLREVLSATDAVICIGNTVLCRPYDPVDMGNRSPTESEADNCGILIRHTVKYTHPRSILLLGRVAYTTFLKASSKERPLTVARQRTSPKPNFKWFDIPVFVTWHPAYVLRRGGVGCPEYYEFVEDVARALRG
jgi:uracil-DNA glycosylase family 4